MRIRTIKPEFWTHPVMSKLDDTTRLLAIGLLNYADDEGYFQAEAFFVRAALRPRDQNLRIVERSMANLERAGWIELSDTERGRLGRVVNFRKHQTINKPAKSKLKPYWPGNPPSDLPPQSGSTPGPVADDSGNTTVALPESYRQEQGTGNREQGKEQESAGVSTDAAGSCQPVFEKKEIPGLAWCPPGFAEFWEAYPNKKRIRDAVAAWLALQQSGELPPLDILLRVLEVQKRSDEWQRERGRYIPKPAAWLNSGAWADVPEPMMPPPEPEPVVKLPEPPENWREIFRAVRGEDAPEGIGWTAIPRDIQQQILKANE